MNNPGRLCRLTLVKHSVQGEEIRTTTLVFSDVVVSQQDWFHNGYSHSHLVLRGSPDEEVCIQVQPVRSSRALSIDMRLSVHRQHAIATVAVHQDLVPFTRLDPDLAGDDASA